MSMSNTDEIVERLRAESAEWQRIWDDDELFGRDKAVLTNVAEEIAQSYREAAALIEQQRDEIARLRGALVLDIKRNADALSKRLKAAAAVEGTTPAVLDRQGPRSDAG